MVIKSGSVQRDEPIVVRDSEGRVAMMKIGEFVDECIDQYGSFNDSFENEVCGAIPYEVMTVDDTYNVKFKPLSSAIRHLYRGPLYSLRTQSGRSVIVTPNHSVFILRNGRIFSIATSDLREGELLVISRNASTKKQGTMTQRSITPSIGKDQITVVVSGSSQTAKLVSPVLYEDYEGFIIEHAASTQQSSDFTAKAFPAIASGLAFLRLEIYEHRHHEVKCELTYRRICELIQRGGDGGVDRLSVVNTLEHVLTCEQRRVTPETRTSIEQILNLAKGDVSFDPLVSIETTSEVDEYVYDVSVPGVERFIGGRSGILLHNSANAAHLRELTTPKAVWLGVYASVTGDEPVVIELDGMIRNEETRQLYPRLSKLENSEAVMLADGSISALSCSHDGRVGIMPLTAMTRHRYDGDIYEIRIMGGYNVKATTNHSIEVFNSETYSLESREVSSLAEGDLVAACFSVPNNQSLNALNIAKLIATECPEEAENFFVEGADADEFCRSLRGKYDQKTLRRRYYQLARRNTPKLSYFIQEGILPSQGFLRLRYSTLRIPIAIEATPEFGRLLGYHAAEGNTGKTQRGRTCELTFGGSETNYVEDSLECVRKVFGIKGRVRSRENRLDVQYGAKLLATIYLKAFHTGEHARDKRVPFIILNMPNEVKTEFLRGCFRGDRMINYNVGTRMSLKTVSRMLASDLTVLLRQLGCVSNVWRSGDAFVVSCANTQPISDIVTELCRKAVDVHSDIKSMPGTLVYSLRTEMKKLVPYGKKGRLHRTLFTNAGKARIGYTRLSQAFEMFEEKVESDKLQTLIRLVKNDVVLLPVKSITNLGKTSDYVYDLEVRDVHTFVGGVGGLVLHNSDIVKYKLPSDKLTDVDIKRLYELKADPRYTEKMWHDELDTFLRIKKKSEQEAFSRYGLSYIVDTYLPEKLQMMKSV
ncbi:MAG: hypothetical protein OK422_04275 [Thaumarchaeota archaeon]|nr:hypothetical protein [Nitrososphaerota archaeon]